MTETIASNELNQLGTRDGMARFDAPRSGITSTRIEGKQAAADTGTLGDPELDEFRLSRLAADATVSR